MSKIAKDTQKPAEKPKEKYRVINWSAYNKALVNRGNITIYFSDEAIKNWYDDGPVQRGGQFVYSGLCIETLLMLKVVFKLAYTPPMMVLSLSLYWIKWSLILTTHAWTEPTTQ